MEGLTLEAAAAFLGMSLGVIRKFVRNGIIPACKVSGCWFIDKEVLQDWARVEAARLNPGKLAQLEVTKKRETICVSSFLSKKNGVINLFSVTKSEAIKELVDHLAAVYKMKSGKNLLDAVRRREMLCSTAVAREVALPHPRRILKERFRSTRIVMGISKNGVDFQSEDGYLAHVIVLFCAPGETVHLKVLAKLSRLLRNYSLVASLKKAETLDEAIRIFTEAEIEDAAVRRLKLVKNLHA